MQEPLQIDRPLVLGCLIVASFVGMLLGIPLLFITWLRSW